MIMQATEADARQPGRIQHERPPVWSELDEHITPSPTKRYAVVVNNNDKAGMEGCQHCGKADETSFC